MALTDIVPSATTPACGSASRWRKDMIAVRIGPDMRMAVVGVAFLFREAASAEAPQDLMGHNCINLRLPTYGGLYAWEFEKDGRELKVRVEGQLVFNRLTQIVTAALAGFGLGLPARGPGGATRRERAAPAGARGLVPAVPGLSPLLSEPPPILAGLRAAGRRAALSRVARRVFLWGELRRGS